ncbi:MAG: hypothetical protein EZS28_008510 [Streblomastix strix]|uniref:Uncharacterized protein n=1 Tax=Streblomastix strix TaxID=222440 RepID=A0A5J4WLW0_9EUKA|nr:MAG: hypothetical protein EZS28_008510 [Streblomastix strix]
MIHPAIGGALCAGANLAGAVDRLINNQIPLRERRALLPLMRDSGTGTAGTSNIYANAQHQHPLNVDQTVANVPLTGGLATEILYANGETTTTGCKLSRTYNGSAGGWIRLCVFTAGASVGNSFIEFKIYSSYNAVQTIRLVPYYTVNGINTVYGIFTAPTKVSSYYDIDNGVNLLFHNHSGSGISAIYSAYVRLESAGNVTIEVYDQSTYYTNRISEILTQDVVSGVSNGRTYTIYNDGIRIRNYNTEYSSLCLGCATSAINTTQLGQWEISKTSDKALTINPSSLRQADHSVGLSINSDSSKITFNGNELVNVGIDQTINGRNAFGGTTLGSIQLNPTTTSHSQGIRISRKADGCGIYLGVNPNQSTGVIDNQQAIYTPYSDFGQNPLRLTISLTSEVNTANRGLHISAEGNTLTFIGQVL